MVNISNRTYATLAIAIGIANSCWVAFLFWQIFITPTHQAIFYETHPIIRFYELCMSIALVVLQVAVILKIAVDKLF